MPSLTRSLATLALAGGSLSAADNSPLNLTLLPSAPTLALDLSATLNVAAGGTSDEEALAWSQRGGHDPARDGFSLQQLELIAAGAIGDDFSAEVHLVVLEDSVELEEAYGTQQLAHGFEVEGGYMLSEFGRYNPQHPHAWTYVDRPLAVGALLGEEGMRDLGLRLGWRHRQLAVHLSVQNGDDDSMTSFLGEGHDHGHEEEAEEAAHDEGPRSIEGLDDLMWSSRAVWTGHHNDEHQDLGLSLAYGDNDGAGFTWLAGLDGSVTLGAWSAEAELIGRRTTLEDHQDWGAVIEVGYQLNPTWQLALRAETLRLDLEEDHDESTRNPIASPASAH
ncbi:MAG: hypothetical protein ACYTF0_08725 [Planctomycetota bacterium]|jgi:hypothetical protein